MEYTNFYKLEHDLPEIITLFPFHKISIKHLQKYVDEFSNRQKVRELDTIKQIDCTINGLVGKRLKFKDLVSGEDGRMN